MNIFVLDESPRIAASYHADIHLGKMILESAQMMSCHAANAEYKPTHQKHPCTLWVGESLDNWQWLKELCLWLDIERRKTGKQPHKSWEYIKGLSPSSALRPIGLTPFALAMPDDIKHDSSKSAVQKYQQYYKSKRNDMKLEYLCRPVPIFLL